MVIHLEQIVVTQLDLALDPLPALCPALQVGHPHDVVKRHPQCEPARHLQGDRIVVGASRVGRTLGLQHLLQAGDVARRVGWALVVQQARMAQCQHFMHLGRENKCQIGL